MNGYASRVSAIAALVAGVILGGDGHAFARGRTSTVAAGALPRPPLVLAQAHPEPAVPLAPVPAPEQRIGLPLKREYEPIAELRTSTSTSAKP
jgi:hypothetical protein